MHDREQLHIEYGSHERPRLLDTKIYRGYQPESDRRRYFPPSRRRRIAAARASITFK